MRVHLVSPAGNQTGGYSRYATGLAQGLRALGHGTRVSVVHKTEFRLRGRPFLGDTLLRLRTRIGGPRPRSGEVDHATEPLLVSRHTDVVTVHDTIPLMGNASWLPDGVHARYVRRRFAALRGLHVVVPTQAVADELADIGFDVDRITVTYEGVDTTRFRPDAPYAGFEAPGRHLLLVGDHNPRKRWDLVAQAVRELDDVHVWHAGQTNAWRQQADGLAATTAGLDGRWHRLGAVDDATLRALYNGCDALLLPSEAEGFGLPTLEAMACGAPVLVSDLPVFRELLDDHARYCDLTAASVRDGIEATLAAGRRGAKARQRHAASFTWRRVAERTVAAYEAASA